MARRRATNAAHKKGWQSIAIKAMASGATVTEAAALAGKDRATIYRHLESNEQFKKDFDDATEQGTDVLEAEATRRAVNGVDEPVIYQGQVTFIGIDKDGNSCDPSAPIAVKHVPLTIRKPSDTLMIFMLKARRPNKFRDNSKIEHALPEGTQFTLKIGAGLGQDAGDLTS